jgi:hypothetical protein
MIDASMVVQELRQARAVRMAAEEACCDIEEMLWDIERSRHLWRRLVRTNAAAEERVQLPLAA